MTYFSPQANLVKMLVWIEHIKQLEERLTRLSAKSMENRLSQAQRSAIEAEIRATNLAAQTFS
jgi:hypothetical protein